MHLTVEEWLAKFFQPISDVPRNGIVRLKAENNVKGNTKSDTSTALAVTTFPAVKALKAKSVANAALTTQSPPRRSVRRTRSDLENDDLDTLERPAKRKRQRDEAVEAQFEKLKKKFLGVNTDDTDKAVQRLYPDANVRIRAKLDDLYNLAYFIVHPIQ